MKDRWSERAIAGIRIIPMFRHLIMTDFGLTQEAFLQTITEIKAAQFLTGNVPITCSRIHNSHTKMDYSKMLNLIKLQCSANGKIDSADNKYRIRGSIVGFSKTRFNRMVRICCEKCRRSKRIDGE